MQIEQKDKSLRNKVISLQDAVKKFVCETEHVAIGGSLYSRPPMAIIHEILHQKIQGISISRGLAGIEADLLVVGNDVRNVITSWWSPGYGWGMSIVMRKFIEESRGLNLEEWSHLALGLRYKAAAMGLPFLPTLSLLGSDLERVNNVKQIVCPFTGEKVLLIPALYPDVGIIHVQHADKYGNAQIDGYEFMDKDIAKGSSKVIITAEEIIDSERFREKPDRTTIPFFCVDAVVEASFGSYPGECWNEYEADFDHFSLYADLTNRDGIKGVKKYLDDFVYSKDSFQDFLKSVGESKLEERRRAYKNVLD